MSNHLQPRAGCVVTTGIDGVLISRVHALLGRRPKFVNRVLCSGEQERLTSITNDRSRAASIAGRIAVKEATMKALGGGIWDIGFLNIEVEGGRRVAPAITLHGRAKHRAESLQIDEVKVSLSHDGDFAIASATAVRWCSCNPS